MAQKTLGLIPSDVGRPFMNINPPVAIPNLQQMVLQVIRNAQVIEKEIPIQDGKGYQLRILPYRTAEGKHEGAVITLVEIFPVGQNRAGAGATDENLQRNAFLRRRGLSRVTSAKLGDQTSGAVRKFSFTARQPVEVFLVDAMLGRCMWNYRGARRQGFISGQAAIRRCVRTAACHTRLLTGGRDQRKKF